MTPQYFIFRDFVWHYLHYRVHYQQGRRDSVRLALLQTIPRGNKAYRSL